MRFCGHCLLFAVLLGMLDPLPISAGRLFIFIFAVLVVHAALQSIWQILLFDPVVRVVMRIQVVLAFYQRIFPIVMLVLQLARNRPAFAALHIGQRLINCGFSGV